MAGLFVTLTAAVPLAAVVLPHVYRWRELSRLASADEHLREHALNYVYRQAPGNDTVLHAAARQLQHNDWPRFAELFRILIRAGVAERPPIVKAALDRLVQIDAAHGAGGDPHADSQRFLQMVNLLDDAGLWKWGAVPPRSWGRWLGLLGASDDPHARMLAAQLLSTTSLEVDWALLHKLVTDPDADVRLHALLAIGQMHPAFRRPLPGRTSAPFDVLIANLTTDPSPPLARFAGLLRELIERKTYAEPMPANDAIEAELRSRIVQAATGDDAQARAWRAFFFASDQASLRDIACVIAAAALDRERAAAIAESLLTSFNDHEKMSGAVLSGLIQANTSLLAERAAKEDIWAVQQVLRLGLWMQHQPMADVADMTKQSAMLLTRGDDVPVTTVLLAMLASSDDAAHHQALEYLFNPWGSPPTDLVELLGTQRWWLVLGRFLPPEAPGFDMAPPPPPEEACTQIERLRMWYLLHRRP
jgi:hypothetical protein